MMLSKQRQEKNTTTSNNHPFTKTQATVQEPFGLMFYPLLSSLALLCHDCAKGVRKAARLCEQENRNYAGLKDELYT